MEEKFRAQLKKAGLRVTKARLQVLGVLGTAKKPLSAEAVWKALGSETVDQATVYRTLNSMFEAGLLLEIDLEHGHAHFELADLPHHHHAVCVQCDRVSDVTSCAVADLQARVLQESGFSHIDRHKVEFFGVCNSCQNGSAGQV